MTSSGSKLGAWMREAPFSPHISGVYWIVDLVPFPVPRDACGRVLIGLPLAVASRPLSAIVSELTISLQSQLGRNLTVPLSFLRRISHNSARPVPYRLIGANCFCRSSL